MVRSAFMSSVGKGDYSQLTIVGRSAEQHWNVSSATVALGDDKLFSVDNTAVLDHIAGNGVVVLDGLGRHCLQASDLRVNSGLVASQASKDLLTCDSVGLVHSVV